MDFTPDQISQAKSVIAEQSTKCVDIPLTFGNVTDLLWGTFAWLPSRYDAADLAEAVLKNS